MKAKSARGATTRQRILESAAKLVYKKGVNGTSVDDVLNASGTGKSQFYHYFANKEALIQELVDYHAAALPAAQEALMGNLSSFAGIDAWLEQILSDYHGGLYSDGCPLGNLASEMSGQNESIRLNLQATFASWEASLTQGLQVLKGSGQLRQDAIPEELATFCVAAIEGALLLAKTVRSANPLQVTVAQIKSHLRTTALGASKRQAPRRHGLLTFCP